MFSRTVLKFFGFAEAFPAFCLATAIGNILKSTAALRETAAQWAADLCLTFFRIEAPTTRSRRLCLRRWLWRRRYLCQSGPEVLANRWIAQFGQ